MDGMALRLARLKKEARGAEELQRLGQQERARAQALERDLAGQAKQAKEAAERSDAAEKALMGRVMERVRGRADGKIVSDAVRTSLEACLRSKGERPKKREKKK